MRRLFLLVLFLSASLAWGQSPVTVTGTVQDTAGNLATSGIVTFTIQPQSSSIQYTIPNTTVVAPQVGTCGINASGQVISQANLANPCTVWGNDLLSPGNSTYTVCFLPGGQQTNCVAQQNITGASYSLNNPKFAPQVSVVPQYQTITTSPISINLIPASPDVYNIGSSVDHYANGYFDNLYIGGSPVLLVFPIPIASGGTNATTAAQALTNLGALPANGCTTVSGNLICPQIDGSYSPAPGSTLQAVLTAAGASSRVNLSCGTYTATGLSITANNVHLHGAGKACTFISETTGVGLVTSGTYTEIDGISFTGQTQWAVHATSTATGFRFHDNYVIQSGQGTTTFPLAGVWIDAALNDAIVENNELVGNGPSTFSSGNAKGYTILTSGTASGFASNIRIRNNYIHGNNNAISISGFDCSGTSTNNGCQILGNNVNQGNVYDGTEGSGYGIMLYSQGYAATTTSLSRTTNVVTIVVTTQAAGEPWTVGETIMLTGYGFGGSGSSFNGTFVLTGASGGGPYTLTWAQTAPDDSVTGAALAGVIQPPLQHSIVANNIVTNCAGACFYGQGLSDVVLEGNEVSQCDLTIVPSALLHACYSLNGTWHGTVSGNSADTAGHSSAYYLAHTYGLSVTGNVGVNALKDGLRLTDSYDLAVSGNYFAANANGGIVGESTTTINSFHSTFSGNVCYATNGTDCYHFAGLDQYDSVTGGECHGPATGTANACFYALSTTQDITVTSFAADCYADGGTVKGVNYGLRAAGTRITMKANKISGCATDGVLDAGTNDDAEQNNITTSLVGVAGTTSTGLTLKDNWIVGNTTATSLGGATSLINTANIVTIGTLPVYNGSAIQVNGNTLLSATQTGIQGTGPNVATASGSFTLHNIRATGSLGEEVDSGLSYVAVPSRIILCGTSATCGNSIPTNGWFTEGGPIAMAGGTLTISGISPAFTSNATFTCLTWDVSTPANTTSCNKVSGSSITITGTGTDSVTYLLIGN